MGRIRASVVIPVRNGEDTLPSCLDALLDQIGPEDEVLVVDDHSTDRTVSVCERYPVVVLRCPEGRSGAGAARNVGASASQGRVLVFVDADVVVFPGSFERLVERVRTSGSAAVGVYAPCERALGAWSRTKDLSVRQNHRVSGGEIEWFWTAIGAVDASAFRAVGGFDEQGFRAASVEDMELGFRLSRAGYRIAQDFDVTAEHRHRFTLATALRNDYRKARDWARMLMNNGHGMSNHGATRAKELAGLLFSVMALLGAVPPGLAGLGWLLRDQLAAAREEGGLSRSLEYLLCRAALYPAAGVGASVGVGLELTRRLEDRRSL